MEYPRGRSWHSIVEKPTQRYHISRDMIIRNMRYIPSLSDPIAWAVLGERKLRALATAEQKLILAGEDVDSFLRLPGKK